MLNRTEILKRYTTKPSTLPTTIRLARLGKLVRKYLLTVAAVTTTVVAGVATYTFTRPFLYESNASFLIEPSTPTSDNNLSTQINILGSTPLIESAIAKLENPIVAKENLSRKISENLTIEQAKDSRVLKISYRDHSAQKSQAILQALLKTYKEYGATKASEARKLVQTKIPQVKQQLETASTNLTKFRQKHNITDPDTYAASVYSTRQNLESQVQTTQIKMAQTQKQLQELQRQVGRPADIALSSAILSQDDAYQVLVKQFQEAQTNYALELTRFQEAYPTVQALRDRRDQIYGLMQAQANATLGGRAREAGISTEGQSSIKQNLATQLFDTQTRLATQSAELSSLRAAQTKVAQVFTQIPQLQQTYVELQRQLNLSSTNLTKLSEKLEELRLVEAKESTSWQILESPYLPDYPISPNVWLNLCLGGVTGLTLGMLLVRLLDSSDDRLREVEQLQGLSNLPVLGAIPYLARNAKVLMPSAELISDRAFLPPSYSHSAFKEAINSLALNLLHLSLEKHLKSIAFTSATPSEGKSTLIYNLGIVLAELGHRVLLVDADMRKPTIHTLAGIKNRLGLSQAIATKTPWQQMIQAGDAEQFLDGSLHIITAGASPANPMILLESAKMKKLLSEWQESYDYVLVDTPPIVGVTDAQSLAPKMDAVVLVTAVEKATRAAIARAMELLNISHCNVAGILVNLVDKNDSTYYYDYSTSDYYTHQSQPLLSAAVDDG